MNWFDVNYRKSIIESINSSENKGRKQVSQIESEVSNGNNKQYVEEYLLTQFGAKTVKEMPIISCLNLAKKVERNLASVYKKAPSRDFFNVSEEQKKSIELIYADGRFNQKLLKANRNLIGQHQGTGYIVPKNGKLALKIMRPHHFDVIPDESDPEVSAAYIISVYDRTYEMRFGKREFGTATNYQSQSSNNAGQTDQVNNPIADYQDYQSGANKYVVWSKKYNFLMDQNGNVLNAATGEIMRNFSEDEILNVFYKNGVEFMPFFDFSLSEKDYEYWVRDGSALANFAIQFNASFTDVANIVRMQGWSQAYLIAGAEEMPTSVQIGPTKLLKLKASLEGVRPEFGYATPNSDIAGSLQFLESFLYLFLSCEEIDPKSVSTKGDSTQYNSALERYVAMIDKLEATEDHYEIFKCVEGDIFEIIKNYQKILSGDESLDQKYRTGDITSATMKVNFFKPDQPKTEKEILEIEGLKKEMRLTTRKRILMKMEHIDDAEAQKLLDEIDSEMPLSNISEMKPDKSDQEDSEDVNGPSAKGDTQEE